ncbi:MAG: hydantoinase/oxoprolinase family protein [Gammaproteobacteria bacterium]|nr:MAG: hydantoinase/oxoprolinase family protein [Gammaproteobacteria bacterium]
MRGGIDLRRLAIDIGGSFTDLVLQDDSRGLRLAHKLPSTPEAPERAALAGLESLCRAAGLAPAQLDLVLHGTTVATNALLEHKGARVAMLTTQGFRDVLHIGRKSRPLNFSHRPHVVRQTQPLVLRRHRVPVPERIAPPDGRVLVPLDENAVRNAVRQWRDSAEVDAIAICFLFAFLNPVHERRALAIVREEWPEVYACASHEVVPLYREYERFSTTALNAYVGPRTASYIERFRSGLRDRGLRGDLRLMTSAGGLSSTTAASQRPASLLLSGPVGALVAGIDAGRALGMPNVITLDVGGTSADIGVAPGGLLRMKHLLDSNIGGYDIMLPMCDIDTIGAGGGSIAYIDDGGMFRVGPQSAGADPGPACYGRGGQRPTVTDAMVTLGWYRPSAMRAAGLDLQADRARDAIDAEIARPLSLEPIAAAAGIIRIATHHMAEAIRVNSVARGLDPRDFALVAFGGAGASFAVAVASELGIRKVIVPPAAGVGAASGLLAATLRYDHQATFWQRLDQADTANLSAALTSLGARAVEDLRQDGFDATEIELRFTADCRYPGQGYELRVALPALPIDAAWRETVAERFHAAHAQAYARSFPEQPVMLVNLWATATVQPPNPPPVRPTTEATGQGDIALEAGFSSADGVAMHMTRFLARSSLAAGQRLRGPAVIEQTDTTTILYPDSELEVAESGHLVVHVTGDAC